MELHERVRQIRLSKGLKQSYVAERLGMPPASYCKFELGRQSLKAEKIKPLADVLGVRVEDLFDDSTPQNVE
jgi:transcriptional regulator with XRE-family HTH domain